MGNRYAPFLIVAAAAALLTTPIYAQGPQGIVPFLLQPNPLRAQGICGKRESIIAQLESKYKETRRSVGIQQGRGVVEVFASEGGTWTIIVTDTRGTSCLMAAGEAFQTEAHTPPDTPT